MLYHVTGCFSRFRPVSNIPYHSKLDYLKQSYRHNTQLQTFPRQIQLDVDLPVRLEKIPQHWFVSTVACYDSITIYSFSLITVRCPVSVYWILRRRSTQSTTNCWTRCYYLPRMYSRQIMDLLIGQKNGLRAFGYNSAEPKVNPIWIKFGTLWAKCWGLALTDFGRNPSSSDSLKKSRVFVFWSGK